MACSFAPNNLNEIMDAANYLLDNPNCEGKELLQFVIGPDFPTGGTIINKDELATAYLTGKGRARIRGEYIIETSRGTQSIVFTSIPYKVSKEQLILDIDKLCEDNTIEGIVAIRDETNKEGVRFVIELGKGVSPEPIIAKLFKNTRLEDTYSINQVALVNKQPKLLNFKDLLSIYNEHQTDVLTRKTKFDLNKILNRINILNGLLIALEDIDNVIALIKSSESSAKAKINLMEKYQLNEEQAKAILDMKLSRLAKLEKIELQQERDNLLIEQSKLESILDNPIPELHNIYNEIKKTYGDARRTSVIQQAISVEDKEIEFVEPEKCVVILTESGLIKRVPSTSFKSQKRNGKGIKTQDDITSATIRTNTIDSLMVFSNKGNMYRLLVNDIPLGNNIAKGTSVKSLIPMAVDEFPTIIYSIYRDTDAQFVLFTTKNGLVKKTTLEEYIKTKKKNGITAINLKENDGLASVDLIKDEPIILLTKQGQAICFNSTEITPTSRNTSGIKGISLKDGDEVVDTLIIRDSTDLLAIFSEKGLGKKISLKELALQHRGGKGIICYKPTATSGEVIAGALLAATDNILICGNNSSIYISSSEIPILGRTSIGNQIIKNNNIVSISKV